MRGVVLAVWLVGCSSPSHEAPDATPVDGADTESRRPVTSVLARSDGVMWTYGSEACSSEWGCVYGGPTLLYWEAQTGNTHVLDDSDAGAMAIAASGPDAFIVTGVTHAERYLKRAGGGALSIPRPWTRGPAADDTYVYWAEGSPTYAIRRALRSGDGSDVTTIVANAGEVRRMAIVAGYLWWSNYEMLERVPLAGGPVEVVASNAVALGTGLDVVVIAKSIWSSAGHVQEIGIVDAAGAYRQIAPLAPTDIVSFLVSDAQHVYWSSIPANGPRAYSLNRAPLAGGSIETVLDDLRTDAFALTPDGFLVDFSTEGFRTIPR